MVVFLTMVIVGIGSSGHTCISSGLNTVQIAIFFLSGLLEDVFPIPGKSREQFIFPLFLLSPD